MSLPLHNDKNIDEKGLATFADVIVPVPIPKYFTYRIPTEFQSYVSEGSRVVIQFGRKNIYTGIIARFHDKPPENYEARPVFDLLDDIPHVNPYQLRLFHWMAEYYMCTIGEVVNNAMPSGLKLSSESHIEIHPEFDLYTSQHEFSNQEMLVLDALAQQKSLTYTQIGRVLNIKTFQPIIKSLLTKQAIILYEHIKEKYIPKKEKFIRLQENYISEKGALESLLNALESKPKQQDIILAYLQHVPVFNHPEMNNAGLIKRKLFHADISPSSYKTLVKNNILEEYEVIVPRIQENDDGGKDVQLSDIQASVKERILKVFQQKQTVLLHGITGSGKTEIYAELIKNVLEGGGQVLYLLPEIALTTQIVARLKTIFGKGMGVYHSKYSDNERVEVWKGVLNGQYNLVTGVRSSVFLPFDNLSLIIVDEEHETSFKQFEASPRYHARDVAQVLARIHNAKVLLGSATPSVESYYLAQNDKYGLIELSERYGSALLPEINFGDLARERKQKTLKNEFTTLLVEKIGETLAKDEQVIIFQNRRGYAPQITCEDCAWIPKCEHCAVSLTYHMYAKSIRCHYCGFKELLPSKCPACGSHKIKIMGYGTEKLEEDLNFFFPEAKIRRMDLDTTRRKYSYNQIISEFENGDIDILVGTQMVSKGLDFDKVSLVGVLDVDRMLHFPDFRSYERTFQLITQVSGRAGRKDRKGSVIIQTANTGQTPLRWIKNNEFLEMYGFEISERKKYHYPPFYRLIKIIFKHKKKEVSEKAANHMASLLKESLGDSLVLDPHEPMIGKIRNQYLMEILIKASRKKINLGAMKKKIIEVRNEIQSQKSFKQVQVVFDVDPY